MLTIPPRYTLASPTLKIGVTDRGNAIQSRLDNGHYWMVTTRYITSQTKETPHYINPLGFPSKGWDGFLYLEMEPQPYLSNTVREEGIITTTAQDVREFALRELLSKHPLSLEDGWLVFKGDWSTYTLF